MPKGCRVSDLQLWNILQSFYYLVLTLKNGFRFDINNINRQLECQDFLQDLQCLSINNSGSRFLLVEGRFQYPVSSSPQGLYQKKTITNRRAVYNGSEASLISLCILFCLFYFKVYLLSYFSLVKSKGF